jgi:HPt (histidine-containing phosphotransfer) domain-containing protein
MTSNFAVPVSLKIQYLERKLDEISKSQASLQERNYEFIKTMAHQMKGNAVNFEFPLLEQLAKSLESAAQSGNLDQMKQILADVQKAVNGLLKGLKTASSEA